MDEEIKQKLLQYLEGLESAVSEAGGFIQAELPLVVQELVAWVWWSNLVGAVFYAAVTAIIACLAFVVSRKIASVDEEDVENYFLSWIVFVAGVALSVLVSNGAVVCVKEMAKAAVAPRVVVIDAIQKLAGEQHGQS